MWGIVCISGLALVKHFLRLNRGCVRVTIWNSSLSVVLGGSSSLFGAGSLGSFSSLMGEAIESPLISGVKSAVIVPVFSTGVTVALPLDRLDGCRRAGEMEGGLCALSGGLDGGGVSGVPKDTLLLFFTAAAKVSWGWGMVQRCLIGGESNEWRQGW